MASGKPENLAPQRSGGFLTVSTGGRSRDDTLPVSKTRRKRKHIWEKQSEAGTLLWNVTISVPWGGSRVYAVNVASMALAIQKAVERDGRIDATQPQEMVLIGAKLVESRWYHPERAHLLLNTERGT